MTIKHLVRYLDENDEFTMAEKKLFKQQIYSLCRKWAIDAFLIDQNKTVQQYYYLFLSHCRKAYSESKCKKAFFDRLVNMGKVIE